MQFSMKWQHFLLLLNVVAAFYLGASQSSESSQLTSGSAVPLSSSVSASPVSSQSAGALSGSSLSGSSLSGSSLSGSSLSGSSLSGSSLSGSSLSSSSSSMSSSEEQGPHPPTSDPNSNDESEDSSSQPNPTAPPSESSESSHSSQPAQQETQIPKEEPDTVGDMIDKLASGKPVDLSRIGSLGSKSIALGNKNRIYREGPDDDRAEMKRDEQNIKKGGEAGQKRNQEQLAKIAMESRSKKMDIQQKKSQLEERQKVFEDDIRTTDEQFSKKSREQQTKSNEANVKQLEEADAKRMALMEKLKREEDLQKAQMNAAIQIARSNAELTQKKTVEETEKINAENNAKLQEQKKKNEMEAQEKARAEAQKKKEIEEAAKKKQEENEKAAKKAEEERKQQAKQEQEVKRRNTALGKWCNCQEKQVNFGQNDVWHECPSGYLFTGLYRGDAQTLDSITTFSCCQPCEEDGKTVKKLGDCQNGQWQISFDREGWSLCPDNHFISAFYKSSCNLIYCIELARCCPVQESQGIKDCGAKGSWVSSLDGRGWSRSDENLFIRGLYRSGGHWLYNIEYPYQCSFYSYQKQ